MDSMKFKLHRYKSDEETPFLYNTSGHISLSVKNVDLPQTSIRQVIYSLPPIIIGHFVYQQKQWTNAGALIAEHLSRKFVPRALDWIDRTEVDSINNKYDFETDLKGFSSHTFNCNDKERTVLRGTSIGEWNEYPYRIDYKFKYNISSAAIKNYKWLGFQNYSGYKLRDERFKTYIETIVDSQSTQVSDWMYDVDRAMKSIIFLVE